VECVTINKRLDVGGKRITMQIQGFFKRNFTIHCSSTRHHLDSRQTTSQTYSSQSLPFHPGPHCGTPVALDYVVPRTNRKMADRAFSTAAPRAWNQLLTELKRTKSTVAIRRGLNVPLQS